MDKKVKREMIVKLEHRSLYLIQHQVQQIMVTYGGKVILLIYMCIMLMDLQISGYQLHLMQHLKVRRVRKDRKVR